MKYILLIFLKCLITLITLIGFLLGLSVLGQDEAITTHCQYCRNLILDFVNGY